MAFTFPAASALDDWARVQPFHAGDSFAEFVVDPPARPPSIDTATVEEIGSSALTIDQVTWDPTTVYARVAGGVAGTTYNLKCKLTLDTGAKLEIPGTYSVLQPQDAPGLKTLDWLIDPNDSQTWTRDLLFRFGSTFPEFDADSPPAILSVSFTADAGVVQASGAVPSGSTVAVRVYCTTPGEYLVRCLAVLSGGLAVSIVGKINAFAGPF